MVQFYFQFVTNQSVNGVPSLKRDSMKECAFEMISPLSISFVDVSGEQSECVPTVTV